MAAKALMECGDNALLLAIEVSRAGGEFFALLVMTLDCEFSPRVYKDDEERLTIDWSYAIFSRRCFSGQ